ncbi:MAG: lamin tail domain-containing protein, partial [Verrucomicrobia bacterium]|nr:lamin tail domain-containing protein [Verrucomicrobiota bacterium]
MLRTKDRSPGYLSILCCFTLCWQAEAGVLFSESFDGFTGGSFSGGQYQSNLDLAVNGNVPGWSKAGAGAIHTVDHANTNGNIIAPRDFAPMLWGGSSVGQANVLTLGTAITNASLAGQRYEISFLASPSVYQSGSQASTATDGVLIEVLRADNSVLAGRTHLSGAWAGTIDLQPGSMTYVGDGSGDIRLRLSPSNPGVGRFGSAIDNLQLATGVAVASNGTAVINEIHYRPLLNTSPSEFIEIYNAGTNALDLSNWTLSGGADYVFPAGVMLASGEHLTIAQDSNE